MTIALPPSPALLAPLVPPLPTRVGCGLGATNPFDALLAFDPAPSPALPAAIPPPTISMAPADQAPLVAAHAIVAAFGRAASNVDTGIAAAPDTDPTADDGEPAAACDVPLPVVVLPPIVAAQIAPSTVDDGSPAALPTVAAAQPNGISEAGRGGADPKRVKPLRDSVMIDPPFIAGREFARIAAPVAQSASAPGAPVVDRHLDLARGDAWLDTLARDIAATAVAGGRLKFTLVPENLGRLDVDVQRADTGITIHLAAHGDVARDVLTAAQPRLIDDIRAQGVRVAGTQISADTAAFSGDRAGSAPRPPLPPPVPIDFSTSFRRHAEPEPTEPVAAGRYA